MPPTSLLLALLLTGCAAAMHARTPATAAVYVTGQGPGMRLYRMDLESGALRATGDAPDAPDSGFAAFSPDRRRLYVLAGARARIVAFAVDARDGALAKIGEASTAPGTSAPHLSVHPDGRWLFVAFYGSGHVTVHPIAADGSVGPAADVHQPGRNAHMAMPDPSGRFLLVPCLGSDHVAQFRFDAAAGKLAPNQTPLVAAPPGSGPRHLAFHPDGRFAYVSGEKNGTVTAYRWDAEAGTLAPVETLPTVPADFAEHASSHVAVHPSGRLLYVGNRGHGSLAAFAIDPGTGRLTPLGYQSDGGRLRPPRHFAFDPTGRFLLVVNQEAVATVRVFAVDPASGALTPVSEAEAPRQAEFVGLLALP